MSSAFHVCKRCNLDLPTETSQSDLGICPHCGFDQKTPKSSTAKMLKVFIPGAALFVFALGMTLHWGEDSVEVANLQVKTHIGMASAADHQRMSNLCEKHQKLDCLNSNLIRYIKKQPDDLAAIAKLGQLQYQRQQFKDAEMVFRNYFERGGQETKAKFNYARTLWKLGKSESAMIQFQKLIDARPDVMQVTVLENYIQLLVESGKHQKASRLIASVQKKGGSIGHLKGIASRGLASANN